MAKRITALGEISQLVADIESATRKRPICIITTPLGRSDFRYDSSDLERDFEQFCDFYTIETGELTRELTALLPESQGVYGGGARSYPVDFSAQKRATPIRYLNTAEAARKGERSLENDINGHAYLAGLIRPKTSSRAKTVTAKVRSVSTEWLMIQTEDGSLASMLQSTSFPGIPLEWLFSEGGKLVGTVDPETNRFVPNDAQFTEQQLLDAFPVGTVTTGLVKSTNRKSAVIQVHPFLEFEVPKARITGNDRDVIDDYLTIGEVRLVRVYRDEQGRLGLRLDDIDDDEYEAPALALFTSSEPWLVFGRNVEAEIEEEIGALTELTELEPALVTSELAIVPTPSQTGSIPVPGPGMVTGIKADSTGLTIEQRQLYEQTIAHLKGRISTFDRYKEQAQQVQVERDKLARQLNEANAGLRELRGQLQAARTEARTETQQRAKRYPRQSRFETVDEWFREELRRFWLIELTWQERKEWNLDAATFNLGPKFLESLTPKIIDEGELKKALRIVMWLVLGREDIDKIKKAHPLTEGGVPVVRETDQAVCMRLYVEEKAASAKRIHYYKSAKTGVTDLVTLAVHDDYDY